MGMCRTRTCRGESCKWKKSRAHCLHVDPVPEKPQSSKSSQDMLVLPCDALKPQLTLMQPRLRGRLLVALTAGATQAAKIGIFAGLPQSSQGPQIGPSKEAHGFPF